ncbi:MAG: penicillin acylase family protein [Thermoplasmata archaeon]|nr:penicillin acylase family protein [Candidatus Sysuiplasma acidicola]MBX8646126.1 penicillin acylase family protein [Candidatus Sysuiplasma acidicola]
MKNRWVVAIIAVLVVLSFLSTQFVLLNPVNGLWSTINDSTYRNSTLNVPHLTGRVQVTIDASGVAHITASNNHDLFVAQGYYAASNRLFQMELQVLLASGNLSGYVGKAGVPSDMTMHLIGLPQSAFRLQSLYKADYPSYYAYLQDYCTGVNDFINSTYSSPAFGFKLLNAKPFYWSPFDILVWQEYMSWSLITGSSDPLASAMLYNSFGFSNLSQIWPYYPYYTQQVTVVPGDGTVNGYNLASQSISPHYLWSQNWYAEWATGVNTTLLSALQPLIRSALANISDPYAGVTASYLGNTVGSNSWVVTSKYSTNGMPMLANDPHLTLYAPSLWIPMQLEDGQFNVTGWALAGIPGILIGHTATTSWGLTTPEGNSANDYLEILSGNNYLYNGTWHSMSVFNYTLLGRTYSVYSTNNGPLIARNAAYGISMRWHTPATAVDLIAEIQLDQSHTYSDMVSALQYWGSPPQNFALVSKHNAGIITAGKYPLIREILPNGNAVLVVGSRTLLNGTTSAFEPVGYVPFRYLPQAENPSRGFMFAPNQPTAGMNYPYPFIGGFWASGGRAETIFHFLNSSGGMSVSNMMALQSNVSDYWASQLTPMLLKALSGMPILPQTLGGQPYSALSLLRSWNYTTYADESGITVYWYLLSELYNMTFDRIYAAHGISSLPLPYVSSVIYLAGSDPNSFWFNGNFTATVQTAFSRAVSLLTAKLGNSTNWEWGKVHKLYIASYTGLDALSVGPIPIWGDSHTVSVGGVPLDLSVPEPYVTVSSSLRAVSDPGTGQFYGVFPGGPSENVLSAYFQNQLPLWLNHNYYNMTDQRTVFVIEYT